MGINEVSVNQHKHLGAASLPSPRYLTISLICPRPVHFLILAILFCEHISVLGSAHERARIKAFEGRLHLTRAPRIGSSATLVLSTHSNLPESVHALILFHLPRGIIAESPDQFDRVYFPRQEEEQQHSVRLRVEAPGNYPLQASIYTTLPSGKNIAQHFYTYLLVAASDAAIGAKPFTERVVSLPLQTHVQSSSTRDQMDGALTIRGSVSYFDDNELVELPVQRPQLQLYLDNQIAGDTIIGHTFGDEQGKYNFDSLNHPSLLDGSPRNLYVVLKFDNSVLSISNDMNQTYTLQSETVPDVPDGETIINLAIDDSHLDRGIGHIFNTMQDAHAFLYNRLGWERDRPIQVVWPGLHSISYYDDMNRGESPMMGELIGIAKDQEWLRIKIIHEYAHAVMTAAYGYNPDALPLDNYPGVHRLETVSNLGFAFSEGWAAFMEAAVDNNALNVTGIWDRDSPNIESNQWWTGHVNGAGQNVRGEVVEGTVASILWDIFDTLDSIDLAPNVDDDNISDRLDLFWEIFVNDTPLNITDVAMSWRQRNLPMLKEMEAIYANHHTLSRPNSPPTFQFTSPTTEGAVAGNTLEITWKAFDLDGDDFTIDLFYDIDQSAGDSVEIQSRISSSLSSWSWDTSAVEEDKYYLGASVRDFRNSKVEVYSDGFVTINRSAIYDVNGDKIVNLLDLVAVAAQFGKPLDPNSDANGDGVINILDLVLIAAHLGEVIP